MSLYRDEGVVLRTHKLGEADRIITLLTRRNGRVRAVAKGVRRTTSKFGARLEPFSHVDVQLHTGRSLDIVTQAESLRSYGAQLASDYPRYTAGQVMLETAERFTDAEKEPAVQQFLLLVGGLRALAAGEHAPGLVLDAYLLRSLAVAGYAPSFEGCSRCGAPGPHTAFAVQAGGMSCPTCRPAGAASPSPGTVELMAALLSGDWELADESSDRDRREANGIVAAYLQWHLERGLRSLRLVERTTQAERSGAEEIATMGVERTTQAERSGAEEIATMGVERTTQAERSGAEVIATMGVEPTTQSERTTQAERGAEEVATMSVERA